MTAAVATSREAEAARREWISRAWELGEELAGVRSLLLAAVEALLLTRHSQAFLVQLVHYLYCGPDEPRDLDAERGVIVDLMAGLLDAGDVAGLDWHERHQPVIDAVLICLQRDERPSVARVAELAAETLGRPMPAIEKSLRAAIWRHHNSEAEPGAEVLRLDGLARARRALVPAMRAVRELRAGDLPAARGYLHAAAELLHG